MFCGKCGNEMSNTAKFCPKCGTANPNAVAGRPAPGVTPRVTPRVNPGVKPAIPVPSQLAGKSLYRVALIALGAVHALIFFFMSYGQLGDKMVRQFASQLGFKMASRLTGPNAIQFYGKLAEKNVTNAQENYYFCILFFGLPLVMGILVALTNLRNNTKKSYTLSIVFTVLALLGYICVKAVMPIFEDMFFELNGNMTIVFMITIVQLAVAILGRSKDKTAV